MVRVRGEAERRGNRTLWWEAFTKIREEGSTVKTWSMRKTKMNGPKSLTTGGALMALMAHNNNANPRVEMNLTA